MASACREASGPTAFPHVPQASVSHGCPALIGGCGRYAGRPPHEHGGIGSRPQPVLRPQTNLPPRASTAAHPSALSQTSLIAHHLSHSSASPPPRTAPTGPENGKPEIWVDAEAALIARTS